MEHVHESPMVMLAPLAVLALGAMFAGYLFHDGFIGHHWKEFWGEAILVLDDHKALENMHHVPFLVMIAPLVVGLVGIAVAWYAYIRDPRSEEPTSELQSLMRHSYSVF